MLSAETTTAAPPLPPAPPASLTLARELRDDLARLLVRERTAAADFLVALAEQAAEAVEDAAESAPQALRAPEVPAPPPTVAPLRAHELVLTHPARAVLRDEVEPLTADLRRLHVTVSRRFLEKVAAARAGLSHALPGATSEQVLEAALDLLLERQARRKSPDRLLDPQPGGRASPPGRGSHGEPPPRTLTSPTVNQLQPRAPPGSPDAFGHFRSRTGRAATAVD